MEHELPHEIHTSRFCFDLVKFPLKTMFENLVVFKPAVKEGGAEGEESREL